MFPAGIIAMENDIYQHHKKRVGQKANVAKFKFMQLCRSPFTLDDPLLKVLSHLLLKWGEEIANARIEGKQSNVWTL